MSDKLGGPAGVGSIGGVDRAPTAGVRLPAVQAVIVSRPPDLSGGGPLTVSGILGSATPDGLLPLATGFGTVLLRPLPGAWPGALPGSELSITLGPGSRASEVVVRAETGSRAPTLPGTGPVSARAIGGAEAGLRGMLMPALRHAADAPQPVRAGQMVQGQAAAGAAGPGAQPNMPGSAHAPAANAGLLATTAAANQRSFTPPAAPLQAGDGPRLSVGVETAQAVAGVRGTAPGQAGDLMRQAGLRPGGAGSRSDASLSDIGVAAEPLPDEAPLPPRPDQQLLAAFAHPGMMARMAALLPRPDRLGGLALMLYLIGVRNGGVRAWIGEEGLRHLTRGETAALDLLDAQMAEEQRITPDGRSWSTVLVPYLDGEELGSVLLATAMDHGPIYREEEDITGPQDIVPASTRFVVGLNLGELGAVQICGRMARRELDLVLSLAAEPEPPVRAVFEAVLHSALKTVAEGRLGIRWGTAPEMPELMPSGRSSTCETSI